MNSQEAYKLRKESRRLFAKSKWAQESLEQYISSVTGLWFSETMEWPFIKPSKTGRAWKLRVLKKKKNKAWEAIRKTVIKTDDPVHTCKVEPEGGYIYPGWLRGINIPGIGNEYRGKGDFDCYFCHGGVSFVSETIDRIESHIKNPTDLAKHRCCDLCIKVLCTKLVNKEIS